VDAGTRLDTYFTCPPPDPGYGGGDPECWECQQWFYFFGDVWWEEWECMPTDPSACQAYET
jgi:hypothetical protein